MNASVATNAYRSVKRAGIAEGSTPHSLVAQLYDGAIDAMSILVSNQVDNDKLKSHYLNKCIAIINELQASLHEPDSNPVAENLFLLYGYIIDQLQLFRRDDSEANLTACLKILQTLQEAWSDIEPGKLGR
jgi:flagellar protein FliS